MESLCVLIEPNPGTTDAQLTQFLENGGATEIKVLTVGFISARIPKQLLSELQQMAFVEEQSLKQLR